MSDEDAQSVDRVHQIFIVDGFERPAKLPPPIAENVDSARLRHPGAQHRLWSGNELRTLLAQNFEPEVGAAFECLRPYSFKADLAKYCLIYLFGGLYVDLGMRVAAPMRPPRHVGLVAFKDLDFVSPSWTAVSNGLVWAKPQRREFRIAIDYVVDNCRTKYYGANPLYVTGPALFGRALIAAMAERRQQDDADDQWIGATSPLTPGQPNERLCYVTPDRALIAIRTKWLPGDLAHLGAAGTNNYNAFWDRRCVYGETPLEGEA